MPFEKINKVTVWTLNRATELIRPDDFTYAFGPTQGNKSIGWNFGAREGCRHRLMFEGDPKKADSTEEYFVPIAAKCIGRRYKDTLSGEAGRLLKGIRENYGFFASDEALGAYWQKRKGPIGNVQMSTPALTGFYDLLPKDGNNVLVGYSQGGLVARYLAFLDEYVFGENRIAGVITIQSPNHGSPFAHSRNKDRITRGLVKVLMQLISLDPKRFALLGNQLMSLPFGTLYALITNALTDLLVRDELNPQEAGLADGARSALKWLSGLQPLEFATAFDDLGAEKYAQEFSVLSLVHRYPLKRIVSGAVVGTNNKLDSIAFSVLGALYGAGSSVKPLGYDLKTNLEAASATFADTIMADAWDEIPLRPAGAPDPVEYLKCYENDYVIRNATVLTRAHDFVIPSISQLLEHDHRSVGNLVNQEATHLSGSVRSHPGNSPGDRNAAFVVQLLVAMKERLVEGR